MKCGGAKLKAARTDCEQLAAVLATDATHARTTVSMLLDGRDDHANRSIATGSCRGNGTFADLFTLVSVLLIA